MLFSSELPVQSHMLASIFKNPLSLSGASPTRKPAVPDSTRSNTSVADPFSEGSSPSRNNNATVSDPRERSMSADSGLATNQNGKFKMEVSPVAVEPHVEDYVQRTKKSAGYLRLLLHSRRCGGLCMKIACIKTTSVVEHVKGCFDARCAYPGCITSKKLLEHHETCAINHSQNLQGMQGSSGYSNFCLLCSLVPQATTSPTNRSHYLSPEQAIYSTPQLEESDRYSEVYDRRMHDGSYVHAFNRSQDDHMPSESPIMFDEMIEYNKVPFQDTPTEFMRHSMTSDLPPNMYNDEPPRKIRSKSMNAVSIDWSA